MRGHHSIDCLLLRGQNEANMAQIRFDLCPGVALMPLPLMLLAKIMIINDICSDFIYLQTF